MNKFTVDFNGILTLEAYRVVEKFQLSDGVDVYKLNIAFEDGEGATSYYKDIFTTREGILDVITVTDSNNNKTVFEDYTKFNSCSRSLQDDALPTINIDLIKPMLLQETK